MAETVEAPADQGRAQQRLHDWAPGSAEPAEACGIAITHRIGFQAIAELFDAALTDTGLDPFDLYTEPADIGAALAAAVDVLDEPTLERAAAAAWMLTADGTHAPLRPLSWIAEHRYNPLLAAIQLAGSRNQLPLAKQLTFRTGHPAPRYPTTATPRNWSRLRLPDHHPRWPEPDPAWIPQTLWPTTIPAALLESQLGCPDPAVRAVRGSLLATALARTGTIRDWADICTGLHLPADHATRIHGFLNDLQSSGSWPGVLAVLERLLTGLQQHPPPIDYQARRQLGDDIDLLSDAVHAGRRRHPTTIAVHTLRQQFWERFTGGDIAYAPPPLRIDPATPAYQAFRRRQVGTIGIGSADLFHVAHQHLVHNHGATGPLTWRPERLPSIELQAPSTVDNNRT